MKRKGRQKKKYLGKRSHGRGNIKTRRGAGSRGGRGMGGIDKHKWSWAMNNDKNYFCKHGFSNPTRKEVPVVHLYEINQRAVLGELEKKGDKYSFDFKGKILATGKVTLPLSIRATAWSKNVEKKLSETGGEISKIEGS